MKRIIFVSLFLFCCSALMAGCISESPKGEGNNDSGTITKDDARKAGGRSDNGQDLCDQLSWYGDGTCDDFCPMADPDCKTDCDDGECEPLCSDDADCPIGDVCINGGCQDDGRCGGFAGLTCDAGEFCNYAIDDLCGATDALGTCEPMPDACDLEYLPVCGCDGQTYGNACGAHSAGVSILQDGACEDACADDGDCLEGQVCSDGVCLYPPGQTTCGGIAGLTCGEDQYCHYELDQMCGAADQLGECRPVPEACTEEYAPVCGCDGVTYGNACAAAAAGMSVGKIGECSPQSCGGLSPNPIQCAPDEYCMYTVEAMCGAFDQSGTCMQKPQACFDIYAPVCGCDGKTYGNDCEAASAGVSVESAGECANSCQSDTQCPQGQGCIDGKCQAASACGGFAGLQCGADEFCDYPENTLCGAADQQGICKPRPQVCPLFFSPVCGCDGQTHGNYCEANAAGTDVATQGACP